MTPKDKAQKLIKEYALLSWKGKEFEMDYYKKCALIAVDEIDLVLQKSTPNNDPYANLSSLEYWQEVKQEIEKL
jgi:hypothetical protein